MSPDHSTPSPSGGRRYLAGTRELLEALEERTWPAISAAADLVAETIAAGGSVHVFGTGHSHMLAEELFYRAGGLVRVRPILFEGLMLHASAPLSTALERLPGLAATLLADHPIIPPDLLIVASNSGGNAVTSELTAAVQAQGVRVVAITSLGHATAATARPTGFPRLHELADVVIDNGGCVGDAAVTIDGLVTRVGPTSTVLGAAIVNAIAVEAVDRLVGRGVVPELFTSSNLAGGDEANARFIDRGKMR